ncbi:MAG: phosphate ABC transporter substrate-binding/OmpA family protein [Pseudomonadota bacterium]
MTTKMMTAFSMGLALSMTAVGAAEAKDVVLKSRDGQQVMRGELISADNGEYKISMAIGVFSFSQDEMICEGNACPEYIDFKYDLEMAGVAEVVEQLVPIILDGYANNLDAEANALDETGTLIADLSAAAATRKAGGSLSVEVMSYEGEQLALFGLKETEDHDAFAMLANNEVPIVFTDREPYKAEREAVAAAGGGKLKSVGQERVIAVEGLAVVVHPDNPIPSITMSEIADVLAGRITNWVDLGGPNMPINLYSFEEDTEAFHPVRIALLDPYKLSNLTFDANIVLSIGELTTAVTRDIASFAVVPYSSKRGTRALPVAHDCGIVVEPTPAAMKAEEYPLQLRIYAFNRPEVDGYARQVLDFLDGPDLDGMVNKAGFVDLSVETEGTERELHRLQEDMAKTEDPYELDFMKRLERELSGVERLTTVFRFAPGSNRLLTKSVRDVERAIEYIGEHKPRRVIFAGFTDGRGGFEPNIHISEERAASMMETILAEAKNGEFDGVEVSSMGFGELDPVACNDKFSGRAINRRVEIWVQ